MLAFEIIGVVMTALLLGALVGQDIRTLR